MYDPGQSDSGSEFEHDHLAIQAGPNKISVLDQLC